VKPEGWFDIEWCPDGSDHDFAPTSVLGPYPVEVCTECGVISIGATPGYANPLDVILGALERKGCEPRPVEEPS
jgi:hypothetical protein